MEASFQRQFNYVPFSLSGFNSGSGTVRLVVFPEIDLTLAGVFTPYFVPASDIQLALRAGGSGTVITGT